MLERRWIMPVSFRGTIIDIETSDLVPSKGKIITFGFFSAGEIRIYQRTEPDYDQEFEDTVRIASKLLPRPYYAYNAKGFEEVWLGVEFDLDLMSKWKRLAEDLSRNRKFLVKYPRLAELVSIPYEYYGEIENSGSDIVKLWKEYQEKREKRLLLKIIYHNRHDLIRECCLLLWDENTASLIAELMENEKANPTFISKEIE
ncbi:MAG: ribonuclease H-like domain-containing protein [Nitrososphaerales archaeon]